MLEPAPRFFRKQALDERFRSDDAFGFARVSPPPAWLLVAIVGVGIGIAIAGSLIGRVEVTGRGRGIVRPLRGIRVLTSQVSGTVSSVPVCSGQQVPRGALILTIDAPALQAQVLEADRQLAAVRTVFAETASRLDKHYAAQESRLRGRAAVLAEQLDGFRQSLSHYQQKYAAADALERRGFESAMGVADAREGVAQAQREVLTTQLLIDQVQQELAALKARHEEELWQRRQTVFNTESRRDALEVSLRQTSLIAPDAGFVEAVLVKPGDVVGTGQPVGKLIPADSPLHVVSFLGEKDRAFVNVGDEVRLELDRLPYARFGTLRGRVTRISDDLASPFEVQEALGDGQRLSVPSFRIEIDVTDIRAATTAGVALRSGTLMDVRFTLRRERLVTIVLEPLRRWLD